MKVERGRRKCQRPFRLLEAGRGQQCLWWRAKEREKEKGRIEIEKKDKRKEERKGGKKRKKGALKKHSKVVHVLVALEPEALQC